MIKMGNKIVLMSLLSNIVFSSSSPDNVLIQIFEEKKEEQGSCIKRALFFLKKELEIGHVTRIAIQNIHPVYIPYFVHFDYGKQDQGKKLFTLNRINGMVIAVLHMKKAKGEYKTIIGFPSSSQVNNMLESFAKCQADYLQKVKEGKSRILWFMSEIRSESVKVLGVNNIPIEVIKYDDVSGSDFREQAHFRYELSAKGGVWWAASHNFDQKFIF